jgi:heme O synthase-like polyprenyltransferase
MIGTLISLLVVLLVLVVIFYIVKIAAGNFGIPGPIVQIVGLILGLVFLLYALQAFGVAPGLGHWRY